MTEPGHTAERPYAVWLRATLAAFAASLCGCTADVSSAVTAVNPAGWKTGQTHTLVYRNSDTAAVRDISVLVRRESGRAGPDMEVRLEVVTPDSARFADTLTVPLRSGHEAAGRYELSSVPYLTGARLNRAGDYTFRFTLVSPEVRKGIWAIGIETKPVQNGKGQAPPL